MTKHLPWHLSLFGGLHAERDSERLDKFRTQKTAALLALLALRGAQNREVACALLWPDASPEAARNSLSAALSALRRDLGDAAIIADRQSVALASGAATTDVSEFNAAIKSQDFARAVEIYRGPFLPGFHEEPFPAIAGETEEKARGAFDRRLEELEASGQSAESLELSRRGVELFGNEERWFLALMRAHYGLGDLDAALRAYEALGRFARKNGGTTGESARLLAKTIRRDKERGEAPFSSPVTKENEAPRSIEVRPESAISASESAASEAPRHQLPTQWTRFFGREAECVLLRQWLCGDQKLVTLSGAGGSGKTRLALETLREMTPDWDGDLVFVPLAALSDADLIFSAIRDALQLVGAPDLAPLEHLERALRDRPALLFLDNFEQLVEGGAARLQTLRERLPDANFLVTSRVLLQLPGEREFPVSPLPTPLRNTAPAHVQECASAALFCDRAGLVVDESNAEAIGALCRRLDGIPLALELAAARAKVLSPAQILERLQKHPDFLQGRELGLPARHKTLRATIEWSTELLSPQLRAFWTRLSLFHGGWSLEAAEIIAAPGICEEWETLDWLTQLRECSLVFVDERGSEIRFRMLQTLREFGREQLEAGPKNADVQRSFFDFFLDLAQQAASAMQGPEQTLWLARLDAEQDNLRAALDWARGRDGARGLQLATALIDFWETRLNLDEGRGWIETFLRATENDAAPPSANSPRSRALSAAGRLASHSMELSQSRQLVEQGISLARESGDVPSFVYAVSAFTRFAQTSGDDESDARARELTDEAKTLARESGDKALLLEGLMAWNGTRLSANYLEDLQETHVEAAQLARELGDESRLSDTLNNWALLCCEEGDFDRANALLDESAPIARRRLDTSPWELLGVLWIRSHVTREEGELSLARAALREMWEICRDSSALSWARVMLLTALGFLCAREGNAESAVQLMGTEEAVSQGSGYRLAPVMRQHYNRYRAQAQSLAGANFSAWWKQGRAMSLQQAVETVLASDPGAETSLATRAKALSGVGRLAWYGSDFEASRALVDEALGAARESSDAASFARAVAAFVRLSSVSGDIEGDIAQGRALAEEAVRLSRAKNEPSLLAESLISLAYATTMAGQLAGANAILSEALTLARQLGDDIQVTTALTSLATTCYHEGELAQARRFAQESVALCRRLDSPFLLFAALWVTSNTAREEGDFALAQSSVAEALELCRGNPAFCWNVSNALLTAGYLLIKRGASARGVQLMGAAQEIGAQVGYQLVPLLRPDRDRYLELAREMMGDAAFEAAWKEGQNQRFAGATELALEHLAAPASPAPDPASAETSLATRAKALSGAGRLA